jgi:hypothetical protein
MNYSVFQTNGGRTENHLVSNYLLDICATNIIDDTKISLLSLLHAVNESNIRVLQLPGGRPILAI